MNNREEKCDLGNNDDDGKEKGKKSKKFICLVKQQLYACITFFLHIF